jgi:hypothetical protein
MNASFFMKSALIFGLMFSGCTAAGIQQTFWTEKIIDDMKKRPEFYKQKASDSEVQILRKGICPLDGTAVEIFELPASHQYDDLWNKGYFCKDKEIYWIQHGNGAFIGTVTLWFGPFSIQKDEKRQAQ